MGCMISDGEVLKVLVVVDTDDMVLLSVEDMDRGNENNPIGISNNMIVVMRM